MSKSAIGQTIIWYFADPMCSWCWGFSSVVSRLKQHYVDRIKFALILGGLRPYTQEAISEDLRKEILHHWQQVKKMTGQEFKFEGAMEDGFVYDTEPASRAVVVVGESCPDLTFDYFTAVQRAFYVGHKDVTQEEVLWEILQSVVDNELLLNENEFKQQFHSQEAKQKTQAHFHKCRQFGVRSFPTMILQAEQQYHLLNSGYRAYQELLQDIDAHMGNKAN